MKRTQTIPLPKPAIVAHRGASGEAPENTLASFRLAIEQGADALELDAKLSLDGEIVVIHDTSVDRTTDASGLVRKMTTEQLKALDAGKAFGHEFADERIPTLEDVFQAVGDQTYINIELTNYATPADDLPMRAANLVLRYGMEDRVLFSSYNILALTRIRRALPGSPMGALALPGILGAVPRNRYFTSLLKPDALHPALPDTTPALVTRAHRQGLRVYVYTVNEVEDFRRLFAMGVDGVITDFPARAREVLEGSPARTAAGGMET